MTCTMMGKYYINICVNVKNEIFQVRSASRHAAFETSIRQMLASFCIFCKIFCNILQIVYRMGGRLTLFTMERGSSVVECRTRNSVSPGSNPPLVQFGRLGIFLLSIVAPVDSAV